MVALLAGALREKPGIGIHVWEVDFCLTLTFEGIRAIIVDCVGVREAGRVISRVMNRDGTGGFRGRDVEGPNVDYLLGENSRLCRNVSRYWSGDG